ncbi:MAG: four helix bundle protein [Bacteroidetes bacterium]|nr:MAG: four helix bundle protein [Bacteroidota bacterium]
MRKELENRLIEFSIQIFELSKVVEKDYFETYLLNQLMRSSASAALNYGEAQGAESKKDFIHKVSLVLKELRESNVNLKILAKTGSVSDQSLMEKASEESKQLVSIFYRTAQTAKKNQGN